MLGARRHRIGRVPGVGPHPARARSLAHVRIDGAATGGSMTSAPWTNADSPVRARLTHARSQRRLLTVIARRFLWRRVFTSATWAVLVWWFFAMLLLAVVSKYFETGWGPRPTTRETSPMTL